MACNSDEENPKAITVADSRQLAQTVFADETEGADGVSITTTGAWTSSIGETALRAVALRAAAPTWISISPDRGDKAGNYTIQITLVPNLSGVDRTAVITISCEGTEITVTVSQKGTKEDGTVPETENPVLSGKVKTINGDKVLYDENGAVIGIHTKVYNSNTGTETEQDLMFDGGGYTVKTESNGNLIYIDIARSNSYYYDQRYDYSFSAGKIQKIRYFQNKSSEYYREANFTWDASENISLIRGDQIGVTRVGELFTTFEYSDAEYTKGNFDVTFYLAAQEYHTGTMYAFFDSHIGKRTKNLISKRVQDDEDGDKYDLTENYTYEFDADGYITAVIVTGDRGRIGNMVLEYYK